MALGFSARCHRMKTLRPEVVRLKTADDVKLAGLLYEPRRKTDRAIVYLHGTGGSSVFHSQRTPLLAEEFVDRRMAWFPFNNRGAGVVSKPDFGGGMAHE